MTFEMGGSLVVGSLEDRLQNYENLNGICMAAWPVRFRYAHKLLIPE